ncbi:MAG: hypothetical protein FJ276_05100 [Planctomycetes bacterium]|nr:hypothetical protein [Planctomycetota bacterium]
MDGAETERRIALDRKYGLAGHPLVVSFPVGRWYSKLVDQRGFGSHLRLVHPDVPPSFKSRCGVQPASMHKVGIQSVTLRRSG